MPTQTLLWAEASDLPDRFQDPTRHDEVMDALEFATFILWSLSGRMYSQETTTTEVYSTKQALAYGSQIYPVFMGGSPYNVSSCSDCACRGCGIFHRTRLRGYPVRKINWVWLDGRFLAQNEYVLLDYSVLGLRNNASACNANCLIVNYDYGSGPPPGGKRAAVKLAEELLRSSAGESCQLPERVTSISRQGVTFTLLDPQDFLEKGRTGIYEIDLMLGAANPARALKRARVFSPDIRRAEVWTGADDPIGVLVGTRPDRVTITDINTIRAKGEKELDLSTFDPNSRSEFSQPGHEEGDIFILRRDDQHPHAMWVWNDGAWALASKMSKFA